MLEKEFNQDEFNNTLNDIVRKKREEDKHRLTPQEKKSKLMLRKGSVQLHGAIWDFIESRSMAGIVSSASIIRGYVMNGIRLTMIAEIDKIPSPKALKNVKNGVLREFRQNIAEETQDIEAVKKGDLSKSSDAIFYNTDLNEVLNYYENNPGKFEDSKHSICNAFSTVSDAELIEILGEGDY